MNNLQLILKAASFAARAHSDQFRKGSLPVPYINHPIRVAELASTAGKIEDGDILAAALLHDTVEDCGVTPAELESDFGQAIAAYVLEVTDDKSLEQKVRKQRQIEHAPHLSPGAKTIKLADKISNCTDVMNDPPKGWSQQRLTEYIQWACDVARGLRGANAGLETMFDETVDRAEQQFEVKFNR